MLDVVAPIREAVLKAGSLHIEGETFVGSPGDFLLDELLEVLQRERQARRCVRQRIARHLALTIKRVIQTHWNAMRLTCPPRHVITV